MPAHADQTSERTRWPVTYHTPESPHQAIGFTGDSQIDDAEKFQAHRPVAPDFSVSVPTCLDANDGPVAFQKREVSPMHCLKSAHKHTKGAQCFVRRKSGHQTLHENTNSW